LCALADFSIALNESIQEINKHSFNNFELRIGKHSSNMRIKMGFYLEGSYSVSAAQDHCMDMYNLRYSKYYIVFFKLTSPQATLEIRNTPFAEYRP